MTDEVLEAYKQGVTCDVCGRTRMCWHEWNELLDAATEAFRLLCEDGSLNDRMRNRQQAQHILWKPIEADIARRVQSKQSQESKQ